MWIFDGVNEHNSNGLNRYIGKMWLDFFFYEFGFSIYFVFNIVPLFTFKIYTALIFLKYIKILKYIKFNTFYRQNKGRIPKTKQRV